MQGRACRPSTSCLIHLPCLIHCRPVLPASYPASACSALIYDACWQLGRAPAAGPQEQQPQQQEAPQQQQEGQGQGGGQEGSDDDMQLVGHQEGPAAAGAAAGELHSLFTLLCESTPLEQPLVEVRWEGACLPACLAPVPGTCAWHLCLAPAPAHAPMPPQRMLIYF